MQGHSMPDTRLIVFDCDGVLVDSERISVRVGTEVLARMGWHLTELEFADLFVGCSAEHFREQVTSGLGYTPDEGWEDTFTVAGREAFEADLEPVPGVLGVLDALEAADVETCVASNSGHDHIEHVLGLTGLLPRFEGRVFSAEDVARGKPAPDLFLHAAARSGVAPRDCVVVEDSPFGVTAALAAGMRCLAYAGGTTPASRLDGLGATLFQSMDEVPRLLELCAGVGPT
jgi:HAD superfamily hydrolase (TIGR01509 family)